MKEPGNKKLSVLRQKQRIIEELHRLQAGLGQKQPPFKPEGLAPLLKAKIKYAEIDRQAVLIPTGEGFSITISDRCHRRRQRVLCAHELAHTFLYDRSRMPPTKLQYDLSDVWHEEDICNYVAGEILMPEEAVTSFARRCAYPSIRAFCDLMDQFDVSSEFVAWRLSQLDVWRVIIVLCKPQSRSNTRENTPMPEDVKSSPQTARDALGQNEALAIWKVYKHRDYRDIHIKRKGTCVNCALGASVAYRTRADVVRRETWNLNGTNKLVLAQSCRIVDTGEPHTVSILTVDHEEQEVLLTKLSVTEQLQLF